MGKLTISDSVKRCLMIFISISVKELLISVTKLLKWLK